MKKAWKGQVFIFFCWLSFFFGLFGWFLPVFACFLLVFGVCRFSYQKQLLKPTRGNNEFLNSFFPAGKLKTAGLFFKAAPVAEVS